MVNAVRLVTSEPADREDAVNVRVIKVLLKDLFVDIEHYQRPLHAAQVANLVLNWDGPTAQLLTVNIRQDNTIALVDGSHRAAAMGRLGITSWDAYAWYGLTIEQEAALFLRLQKNRRNHTALGRWKAEITAGDPVITAIDAVVAECGYHLASRAKTVDPKSISCPDRLVNIATGGKQTMPDVAKVRQTLEFLVATWPSDPTGGTDAVLGGISLFLNKYKGSLRVPTAIQKLRAVPLSDITIEAAKIKAAAVRRRGDSAYVCMALQRAYDKGRRGNTRLEPDVTPEEELPS